MSNAIDANEIALEKVRNILIMFEKKKRNLDKRKNKLEDYQNKKDLNEDQQIAVAKYPEVVANLELLEEFNSQTVAQLKEAEKAVKKMRKQEKLEKRRHESNIIEFVMKTYNALDIMFRNEAVLRRLESEGVIDSNDIDILHILFSEIKLDTGSWRKCSELLQSLYEGGSKPLDYNLPEGNVLNSSTKDQLLSLINKIATIEWLFTSGWEQSTPQQVDIENSESEEEQEMCEDNLDEEEDNEIDENNKHDEQVLTKEPELPVDKMSLNAESQKMSFVFLHESVVHSEVPQKATENGYDSNSNQFLDDTIRQRSNSQLSSKSIGNSNPNNTAWDTVEDNYEMQTGAVDDVFSSATQSEFMHSENPRNLKSSRGVRPPMGGRFRGRSNIVQSSGGFTNRDAQSNGGSNYWKSSRGGSYNNQRFTRTNRGGRGRGGSSRGNGRLDMRQSNDLSSSQ